MDKTCNTCAWFYKYVKVCGIDFTMAWKAKPACDNYKPREKLCNQ